MGKNNHILAVIVLVVSTISPKLAYAVFTMNGSQADKTTFETMLELCSGESQAFATILGNINMPGTPNVTINLGRGNAMVDTYQGGGTQTADLDDLEHFPRPTRNANPPPQWNMPPPAPAWAGTLCEQIAHILGEAQESARINGGVNDYKKCHRKGFVEQNNVRRDYGQNGNARPGGGRPTPGGGTDGTTHYGSNTEVVHMDSEGQITSITY